VEGKENTTEGSHALFVLFAPGTRPFPRIRFARFRLSPCCFCLRLFPCPSDCSCIAPWRTIWLPLSAVVDSLRSAFHRTSNC
jgi:hypothetical protein